MLLLIIIVLSALTVSALCSVLEATLLSVSVVSLNQREEQGDKKAARMLDLKQTHLESSIGAILTYNTIAHTIGAALAGAQAARVFGDAWVGLFSAVLTVLILIATEIIPKTLGTVYADKLVGFVGLVIAIMIKPPMRWILYLTHALTRLFVRGEKKVTTRGEILAAIKMATTDGTLAQHESMVLGNLLQFREIKVEDVLTPRTVMVTFPRGTTLSKALAAEEPRAFSRILIHGENRDDILGYVLMRDLLRAAADDSPGDQPITDFMRNVLIVNEHASVGDALTEFIGKNEQIAVVADDLGGVAGLVTLEDLMETALGHEIVDEIDRVPDLRQVAVSLRDRRLARMKRRRTGETEPVRASDPP